MAKAIHNESSRKLKDILIMHSSSIYQDYLCEYLFGADGLLQNIHDGTIIIIIRSGCRFTIRNGWQK